MTLEEIRAKIVELSGSGKRVAPNARRHGIYTSFTLPELDDMLAVRDTRQRFADFGVPEFLSGKLVLDVGCNVGAVSMEFARRGANVTGVEYREDRVALCRAIAEHYQMSPQFDQTDLNALREHETWTMTCYDIVFCSSVDEYISDLPSFYRLLRQLCLDTLYLESNVQGAGSEVVVHSMLSEIFPKVVYTGNGHSGGISRKRKLFVCQVSQ